MKYEKYKDSGVEWIGDIPLTWTTSTLLQVLRARISDGPHETPNLVDEGIPFISVDSLNDSEDIDFEIVKKYISDEDYKQYKKKACLEKGDILFTKSATIGKTAIVKDDIFMVWSPIAILKPNKLIYNKYLYYLVSNDFFKEYICQLSTFSTQFNVGMRTLEKAKICFPSLPEQQAIVNYLDAKCAKINGSIDVQKRKIELLNELKQTIITDAVTKGLNPNAPMKNSGVDWIGNVPEHWKVMKLKRCALIKTGCTPPTSESKYYDSEDINWFTPSDIVDSEIREAEKKISFIAQKDGVCRIFPKNSIYFVGIGSIGKVSYCEISASSNQQINVITPNKRANYKYLTYVLKSQKDEIALTANSVTLPIINQDRTGSLLCPVPPIEEQQSIVAHIESETSKIDAQIAKANRRIELLNELKQSIITEAVTGKIKVC